MAWQDGSKFLIANGVKWGTGPKFYPGPSVDTPWNHVRASPPLPSRRRVCSPCLAGSGPELENLLQACTRARPQVPRAPSRADAPERRHHLRPDRAWRAGVPSGYPWLAPCDGSVTHRTIQRRKAHAPRGPHLWRQAQCQSRGCEAWNSEQPSHSAGQPPPHRVVSSVCETHLVVCVCMCMLMPVCNALQPAGQCSIHAADTPGHRRTQGRACKCVASICNAG